MDYKEIVLNGFRNNHEYLDKYFIRKFKEAESKNYVFGEFFKGCLNVAGKLDKKLKEPYYADKKEFQENLQYAISTNDKDAENHFRERLNELNDLKECNYSVNLYQFTKGKFTGDLDCEDIKYIALSIGLAIQDLQPESKPEPPGAGEKIEPINPYTRYFINGYYWQLFNEWPIGQKKLADYSFIYRVMYDDSFIHAGIGQKEFKTWVESTFSTGDLGKQLKQLNTAKTKQKFDLYASLIDKYQLHSKTLQKRSTNTTET